MKRETEFDVMRKIFNLLICIIPLLALVSCEEESVEFSESAIIGKWQWISSSGGIGGWTYTPISEGYNQSIEFTSAGKYIRFVKDTLNEESQYSISTGKSIFSEIPFELITYEDKSIEQAILSLKNDKLQLGDNCYDCFRHTFRRTE